MTAASSSSTQGAGGSPGEEPVGLLELLSYFIRRLPLAAGFTFVFALGGLTVALTAGYKADSSFAPSGPSTTAGMGALGGLAAQLGVSVGDESIFYYAELVRSRGLRKAVAETEYRLGGSGEEPPREADLVTLLDTRGDSPEERLNRTVADLEERISVSTSPEANIVRVQTIAPSPELAVQMNRRVLDLINEFNLERKQEQAAAEQRFVEVRLDSAKKELREAEREYSAFLTQNRQYQNSPELSFEAARLERRISLRQTVYSTLANSLEQARIEAVRNTPVITPVDMPEGSTRPARPLLVTLIVWSAGGFVVATLVIAAQFFLDMQRRRDPESYREFVTSLRRLPSPSFRRGRSG